MVKYKVFLFGNDGTAKQFSDRILTWITPCATFWLEKLRKSDRQLKQDRMKIRKSHLRLWKTK